MDNQNIAIRKISTFKLILLTILTMGVYWYVWLWKLITDINRIYPKKKIHRYKWFMTLIGLEIISVIMDIKNIQNGYIINIADVLWFYVNLILTLQILKNIEAYVKNRFDIIIKHNVIGWIIFGSFYVNYKINRLNKSIQDGINCKVTQMKLFKTPNYLDKILDFFRLESKIFK